MPSKQATYRVMIAAGGTGGHVYPAISIADALTAKMEHIDIAFIGTKNHMEWTAVPKAGYRIYPIWVSGLQRRFTLSNLLFPLKLIVSLVQSFWLLQRLKPAVMVSCGGYVAGPVGWMASRFGIPVMIQEQNSYPGIVTRMFSKKAKAVFLGFENAKKYLKLSNNIYSGNPVLLSNNHNINLNISKHLLSRFEVEQVLGSRTTPVTAVRAGIIIGPGGSSFRIVTKLVQNLPIMACPEWTKSKKQPIDLRVALKRIDQKIGNEKYYNNTFFTCSYIVMRKKRRSSIQRE